MIRAFIGDVIGVCVLFGLLWAFLWATPDPVRQIQPVGIEPPIVQYR